MRRLSAALCVWVQRMLCLLLLAVKNSDGYKTETVWNFIYSYAYTTGLNMYKLGFASDFEPRSIKELLIKIIPCS